MSSAANLSGFLDVGTVLFLTGLPAAGVSNLSQCPLFEQVFWVRRMLLLVQANQPGTVNLYRGDSNGNLDWSVPAGTFGATGTAWASIGIPSSSSAMPLGYACKFSISNTGASAGNFELKVIFLD